MQLNLLENLQERYKHFFNALEIDECGILHKISNPRYKNANLRFSGLPYIGSNYSDAKKKILFVGHDIGNDELYDTNSFHGFDSRRERIAGAIDGCITLDYNDHISGTYISALFLLKEVYNWEKQWKEILSFKENKALTIIGKLKVSLPVDVLDYIALTNMHKFVTVGRINRTGSENRRWYNRQNEENLLLEEVKVLKPDLVYFQGSAPKLSNSIMQKINSLSDVCVASHPSSWRNEENKPSYMNKIKILSKIN